MRRGTFASQLAENIPVFPSALQPGLDDETAVIFGGQKFHAPLLAVLVLHVHRGIVQLHLHDLPPVREHVPGAGNVFFFNDCVGFQDKKFLSSSKLDAS